MLVKIWNQWEVWAVKEKAKGRNNGMLEEVGERSKWRSCSSKENRGKQRPKMKLEHLEQRKLPMVLRWCNNTLKGGQLHLFTKTATKLISQILKIASHEFSVFILIIQNFEIWVMKTKTENSTKHYFSQWVQQILSFKLYNWKQPNPNTL